MDATTMLENPYVAGVLGAVSVGTIAYIKRWFDLRSTARDKAEIREQTRLDKEHANTLARLDIEAQKLVIEQELLAEKKRRTTGRATPTGLRHQVVKQDLSKTFPEIDTGVIDERIREHAKTASQSVKRIAPSIMPTPSESAQMMAAVRIPENPPPPLPRLSGDHETLVEFDLPRDEATLDDINEEETNQ